MDKPGKKKPLTGRNSLFRFFVTLGAIGAIGALYELHRLLKNVKPGMEIDWNFFTLFGIGTAGALATLFWPKKKPSTRESGERFDVRSHWGTSRDKNESAQAETGIRPESPSDAIVDHSETSHRETAPYKEKPQEAERSVRPGSQTDDVVDDLETRPIQRPRDFRRPFFQELPPDDISVWAVAAMYIGLVSVLCVPAPLALICGIMAIREMRRNPKKCGMVRAVFGILMGGFWTIVLAFFLIALVVNGK